MINARLINYTSPLRSCFYVKKTILAIAILTFALQVSGAEYSLDYSVRLESSYDDNVRLNESDDNLSGATISPSAIFSRDDSRNLFTSSFSTDVSRFNQDGYDTEDFNGGIRFSRLYERGNVTFNLNSSRDSTRTTEAAEDGSGIIEAEATRVERHSANASWLYRITPRQSLGWTGGLSRSRYESPRFSDSDIIRTGLTWRYLLSERLTPVVRASYVDVDSASDLLQLNPVLLNAGITPALFNTLCFDNFFSFSGLPCEITSDVSNKQQVADLQIGFDYFFTEKWKMSVLVGQTNVDTKRTERFPDDIGSPQLPAPDDFLIESDRNTSSYSFSMDFDGETIDYQLIAAQENNVDSFGRLTLNTQANITLNWTSSERSSWKYRVGWFDREASDGTGSQSQSRDTLTAMISNSHKLTEVWHLHMKYQYQVQDLDFGDSDSDANRVSLTVEWRPTTLKWSR